MRWYSVKDVSIVSLILLGPTKPNPTPVVIHPLLYTTAQNFINFTKILSRLRSSPQISHLLFKYLIPFTLTNLPSSPAFHGLALLSLSL